MHGEVKVWFMSEEERLAYIEKHPIRPTKKAKQRAEQGLEHLPLDNTWKPKEAKADRSKKEKVRISPDQSNKL